MKKTAFSLLLICVLLLSACGGRQMAEAQPTPTPEATAAPTPAPTPAPFSLAAEKHTVDFVTACSSEEEIAAFFAALQGEEPQSGVSASALPKTARNASGDIVYSLYGKELRTLAFDGTGSNVTASVYAGIDWHVEYDASGAISAASEKNPLGLFCEGHYIYVISESFGYTTVNGTVLYDDYTVVDVYDCADVQQLILRSTMGQDGSVICAGVTENGLCVVTDYPVYDAETALLPRRYGVNGFTPFVPGQIALAENGAYPGYAVVSFYTPDGRQSAKAAAGLAPAAFLAGDAVILSRGVSAESPSREYRENCKSYKEIMQCDCTELYSFVLTEDGVACCTSTVLGLADENTMQKTEDGFRAVSALHNIRTGGEEAEETGYAVYSLSPALEPLAEAGQFEALAGDLSPDSLLTVSSAEGKAVFENREGQLAVSLWDNSGNLLGEKVFGADFSSDAHALSAAALLPGRIVVVPARDSLCFYEAKNGELSYLAKDVFLQGSPADAEILSLSTGLYIVTARDIVSLQAEDYSVLSSETY